ncbi:hypothetical protein K9N68_23275 [Kovacikia minuta CCNUW1]|uniref:hypothetical protein n=1 Tax=Kovacikia minuta TaxID=2931930 RepID=UPI001CCB8F56|nr:hypothetical protein [Kovacikia minuta]UBF24584.1 hypothetical protein K9N68_23275 [Kovacikia minuta CCNUW1]
MSTFQPNYLELAKQGDPNAIATLMNRSLQAKGITTKAFLKDRCLSLFLESDQAPDQQILSTLVYKGLVSLGITAIQTVKLYGRKKDSDFPDWQQEFILDTYVESKKVEPDAGKLAIAKPQITVIQPISSPHSTQLSTSKLTTQNNRGRLIVILSAATVFLLSSAGMGGWIFWTRSAQAKIVAQADELVGGIKLIEAHSNLDELKADQKQLQSNQKKLEDAIALLSNVPKLPVLNLQTIEVKRSNAQTQLTSVEQSIQGVEQQIKHLEQLLPVLRDVTDKFSALASRLSVGMNYRDYGQQVRELKVVLDRLERQSGGSNHPAYKELADAFKEYNFAYDVWQYYIESDETHNFLSASSPYGETLIGEYGIDAHEIAGDRYIYLNSALSTIWGRAKKSIKSAQDAV